MVQLSPRIRSGALKAGSEKLGKDLGKITAE
jgi:hypothetical protein